MAARTLGELVDQWVEDIGPDALAAATQRREAAALAARFSPRAGRSLSEELTDLGRPRQPPERSRQPDPLRFEAVHRWVNE